MPFSSGISPPEKKTQNHEEQDYPINIIYVFNGDSTASSLYIVKSQFFVI
jgi:hypothetical protein